MHEKVQDIFIKDIVLRLRFNRKWSKILHNRSYNFNILNESIKWIRNSYRCEFGITWYNKTNNVENKIRSKVNHPKIKTMI